MSGFGRLFVEAAALLALAAIVGVVVGWSFGALRASRTTTERYEQQMRATLRRMSDAEAEAVTLRGRLEEREGMIAAQQREHESQEHLLAALEARLAEAEAAAAESAKRSLRSTQPDRPRAPRPVEPRETADSRKGPQPSRSTSRPEPSHDDRADTRTGDSGGSPGDETLPGDAEQAEKVGSGRRPSESASAPGATRQNGAGDHLDGIEAVVARTAGEDDVPNDDLTRIKGIGKVIERTLKDLGLTSYRQIASLTEDDIDLVEEALDTLRGRIRRDDWMTSAAELHMSVYGAEV